MNLDAILQNQQVKDLLNKAGVSEQQAKGVANTALGAIQSKFKKNPSGMSSLLSDNPNTEEDEKLKSEVEDDFVSQLIEKIGLSDEVAKQIKGAVPGIMSQVTSSLSASGNNNESGLAGMLGGLGDFFDGDNKKGSGKDDGLAGMIKGMFN